MKTHDEMLTAVLQSEAAWNAVRKHYWRGKNIRDAVRLAFEEMSANQ